MCCCIIRIRVWDRRRFHQAAADDPQVVGIKMCLYRTGKNSPIPQALMAASERGKQVTAVVEIKAEIRRGEQHRVGERLAESGVHVVYGVVGLKTHSKVALVVRREQDGLKTYTHIATGNYNPTTSKIYTDLGLLHQRFHNRRRRQRLVQLSYRFSIQKEYSRLMIAPLNLRKRMMAVDQARDRTRRSGNPLTSQPKSID
jgi:polyphosphate kinase